MEMIEYRTVDEGPEVSVPLGGPIFVPDLVSSLTSGVDFQNALIQELEALRAETCLDPSRSCDEDLSVDELKIFYEEDLLNQALNEAFKDDMDTENSLAISKELSNERHSNVGSKKRKRRGPLSIENNNRYMERVEQFVKIKQKQDEEKAAARLHSFNGGCDITKLGLPLSRKHEKTGFLKSISSEKVKSSNVQGHMAVSYPELVLRVEVWHKKRSMMRKSQELFVLGRQTLTELRDRIYCLTDKIMLKAEASDPSGYFLIEDVFYNDLRAPDSIDYSKPIFDWLKKSREEALEKWKYILSGEIQEKQKDLLGAVEVSDLPPLRTSHMQRTRFCDLKFRVGAGYLYCHQGDCKHLIVIRDMRMIHPEDVQNRAAYPLISFQQKLRVRKCQVCGIYWATKMTVDDKWAQENPCYFCNQCYFNLHYAEDMSLLYKEFSVYDYFHD